MASALKQALYYAGGIALAKSASLLFLPVVTSYLSPEEYGTLDVILTFANFSSILLGFGLVSVFYRFIGLSNSSIEINQTMAAIVGLSLLIALSSEFALQLFVQELVTFFPEAVTELHLRLIAISLALEGLIGIPLAWLRFKDKARQFFILTTCKELSQLSIMYLALTEGYGVTGMLAAGAFCTSVFALYLTVNLVAKVGIRFSAKSSMQYLAYGWPVVISGLAAFVLVGLDRWVIANYINPTTLAGYAVAIKFTLVATFLLQPYTMWWFPKRFQIYQSAGKGETARFSAIGVAISLLTVSFVALVAPVFIRVTLPEPYHVAIQYIPWVLLISVIKSACDLLSFGCFYEKNTTTQMYIQLVSSLIAGLGFFLLIGTFGVMGIIVSLLIANSLRLVGLYIFSQKVVWLPYPKRQLVFLFGVTVLTLFLTQAVENSLYEYAMAILVFFIGIYYSLKSELIPGKSLIKKLHFAV